MHRTTIMLPADLKAKAARHAREMGISLGELIRDSLANWLNRSGRPDLDDPMLSDSAVFEGPAPHDVAANHDGYLYGEAGDLR